MADKITVCSAETITVCGLTFRKTNWTPCCDLERFIPESACIYPLPDGKLFAVKAKIGKDPHPFPALCEAARYIDGAWVVGIDEARAEYFTPLFTNGGA